MGLDMYLSRKTYVKHYDFKGDKNFQITVKQGGEIVPFVQPKKISYLITEVMYWRKANAIHNWFVENVQGGEDDCGTYDVSKEQLQELVAACKEEIKNEGKTENLTPVSGFFFGNTDKDEWYFDTLKETVKVLEEDFAQQEKYEQYDYYEYHSSW
jgi:hypothetical protein